MVDEFSAEILQFIDQAIESVAQLEVLLLLRSDRQRSWTAGEIAQALYIPPEMAASLLNDLGQRGFVGVLPPDARFTYQPADPAADRLLGMLESVYKARRVAVTSLIYSRPLHKVQTFADAFRLRRENLP